jgi:hypothetical protein
MKRRKEKATLILLICPSEEQKMLGKVQEKGAQLFCRTENNSLSGRQEKYIY